MDVHRSRFVPYPAFAITSVAFTRSNNNGLRAGAEQPALKLAIGRENGDIEIWNPQQNDWVQETVFPSLPSDGENKAVSDLVWTREPDEMVGDQLVLGKHRLFSTTASSPAVTEWDLERGMLKKPSTGNFDEIWCLAAQPRAQNEEEAQSQDLVAGCGDGTIVLLSTADNDLQFKRFLARVPAKKAKCVSINYQNRTRVIAGFMDSIIRVFDTRNGSLVRQMSLGTGIPGAPKNTVVWQVKALPNGDIVSGDSNGEVVFWDGRSYSLKQRVRGAKGNESECVDIVTSADGKTVFSGSMSGRIAVYRQATNPTGLMSWAQGHHRRMHDGDVRSMDAFDSDGLSVVVSGGSDGVPMITPLRQFGKHYTRALPTMPQDAPVASAPNARLLVSWWGKSISVWRIGQKPTNEVVRDPQPPRKLVAKITLDTQHGIRIAAISEDGRVLAISTGDAIKVFQLRKRPDSETLGIRKLDTPESLAALGTRSLKFSPDGKWLAAASLYNDVHIARLAPVPSKPKHIQIIDKVADFERQNRRDIQVASFGQYERTITRLAFSSDSTVLVVGDLSGYLDSWVLEGHEDPAAPPVDVAAEDSKKEDSDANSSDDSDSSDDEDEVLVYYGQHWAANPAGHLLPRLESAPLILSFRPSQEAIQSNSIVNGNPGVHSTRQNPHAHSHELPKGQHNLWVMTSQHQMYEFDVLAGRLSDWSRQNPTAVLPEDFTKIKDRVIGGIWDVTSQHERLWLYGCNFMFMLNVGTDLLEKPSKRKRKADRAATPDAKRKKISSGAGDLRPASLRNGMPGSIKRHEDGAWMDVDLDRPSKGDDDELDQDEAEEEEQARLRLTRMRSLDEEQQQQQLANGESLAKHQRRWWCTFKYRPILGVVPLVDHTAGDGDRPLEVVVVERPLWDVNK